MIFFCPYKWRDFFVPRGCVIFVPEMLPDFFVLIGCVILLGPKRLRDYFVPRGCMIFMHPAVHTGGVIKGRVRDCGCWH